MDLSLPGMDGWEATRKLKADRALSRIPIVALSAHAMRAHEERAMESGCDAFLTKPIDETLLFAHAWPAILATDKPVVLVVDDEPLNIDLLEQELDAAGYDTSAATGGADALTLAANERPDLILLDVMMNGMDGYEACRRLKSSEVTRAIPVIFLTALTETFDKVRGFGVGAVDYVSKPFEPRGAACTRSARTSRCAARSRRIAGRRRRSLALRTRFDPADSMIGDSPALRRVLEQIDRRSPPPTAPC